MQNSDQHRLLSALCHGSIFFSSLIVAIGIPIAILLINDTPVIKENAKEAINFHINLYLYAILVGILTVSVVGIPIAIVLGIALAIASFVMPIIAIVYSLDNRDRSYRYPFIWRLL
ncbi:DUF4870 domain-containing protein [Myxacorys almedinensis]|uniref:DUF4870 domain-containing protein n=1 Tax=Myxacorys almedinensis A TaxID=2690445 RepID=A0A8J8CLF8_9CYAN|nr:DUF4870 domain-containing protein [Myxacorys almedinensis]NDJ19596.1 DUF4870 domain-containing protein [Myxacorys almedinensis A]